MVESVQHTILVLLSKLRAFLAKLTNLEHKRDPISSNLGKVSAFMGATLDLEATNDTLYESFSTGTRRYTHAP